MRSDNGRRRDGAASPVVGFVLVMGIALTTMTLVFLWGAPTIESVQSSQTASAANREFVTLSSQIESLLAGAPIDTTPKWAPTLTRGVLEVGASGEVWALAVTHDTASAPTLVWGGLTDGDSTFRMMNTGASPVTLTVEGLRVAGETRTDLAVGIAASCGSVSLPSNVQVTVTVYTASGCGNDPVDLVDDGFHLTFGLAGPPAVTVAQVSMLDAGLVSWDLPTADLHYREEYSNGAVLTGQLGALSVSKRPVISPPRPDSTDGNGFFVRLLRIDRVGGGSSATTEGTTPYFLRNAGSYVRLTVPDAADVHVHPPAGRAAFWNTEFTKPEGEFACTVGGVVHTWFATAVGAGDMYVHGDPSTPCYGGLPRFKVGVAHSTVTMQQGGET